MELMERSMAMALPAKLRRVTDLFERGKLIWVEDDSDGSRVYFWVKYLNSFEQQEALSDGRFARGLRVQRFETDERERNVVEGLSKSYPTDRIVSALLEDEAARLYSEARDAVRAKEKWQDGRLDVLDRAALGGGGRELTDEELKAIDETFRAFQGEVSTEMVSRANDLRAELTQMSRSELEAKWREAYISNSATQEFLDAKRQTEVYYALCDVEVEEGEMPKPVPGQPKPRLLEDRNQVRELPDALYAQVCAALDEQVTMDEAGNSPAPSASSEPSGPASSQEDSKGSGQKAASSTPPGSSSTQSPKR